MNEAKRVGGQVIQATLTFDHELYGEPVEVKATVVNSGRVVLNGVVRLSDGKQVDLTDSDRGVLTAAARSRLEALAGE